MLLAQASVAGIQGRSAKRDALLLRLIGLRSVSALAMVARLPPGAASPRLLRAAVTLALGLTDSYAPIKAAIGVIASERATKLGLALSASCR